MAFVFGRVSGNDYYYDVDDDGDGNGDRLTSAFFPIFINQPEVGLK